MEDGSAPSRPRKRPRRLAAATKPKDAQAPSSATSKLREMLQDPHTKIVVFSGSGMSVAAGLPTFSGDLYQRAAKKYKLKDGSRVFSFRFLESNPNECFRFFKDLYNDVTKALPTPSHFALKALADSGRLIRHYTLNFDGLATACGMSLWNNSPLDPRETVVGTTVELHGNIHELVCRQCGSVSKMSKKIKPIPQCEGCMGDLRFRVLLYDDKESHLMSPVNPMVDLLPRDVAKCSGVLWVGISFRQSASCQHFGTVLSALRAQMPPTGCTPMFIIDPHPNEALENLMDGLQMHLGESQGVYTVEVTSDEFFQHEIPL